MVQAAVSGRVDFREARQFHPPWQRKLRLLLRGLHQENERNLQSAVHRQHTALLGIARISEQSLTQIHERCKDDLHDLTNLYRPWAAKTKEEREKAQISHDRNRWQNRFGDLSAADTQAKIEATVQAMRKMRDLAPPRTAAGDWFALYNRQTAQALEGMQQLRHARPNRH